MKILYSFIVGISENVGYVNIYISVWKVLDLESLNFKEVFLACLLWRKSQAIAIPWSSPLSLSWKNFNVAPLL